MSRFVLTIALLCPSAIPAADLTVVDASGKEIAVKKWRIAGGTRPLGWLAKDSAAPEALAFRETNSTGFKDGVLTFVPLERLEELSFDADKQLVYAKIAGGTVLEGPTRFQGINQFVIEAEIDKGEAGVVELKYRGGMKGGVKAFKFSAAKAPEAPKGEQHYVVISDSKKGEPAQAAHNLRGLYRADKSEKLLPTLMFKKTFKVDLGQVKRMMVKEDAERAIECDLTLADGSEQTLTLLTAIPLDGKTATLEGLLAEVPAGYKLFPMHTIAELNRDMPKTAPAKPEGLKKKGEDR